MNRALKEAAGRRHHYESHRQLEARLQALSTPNSAKRLKTLRSLTPYEAICKETPERFRFDPVYLTSGRNT